jgi:hypothetical protein
MLNHQAGLALSRSRCPQRRSRFELTSARSISFISDTVSAAHLDETLVATEIVLRGDNMKN